MPSAHSLRASSRFGCWRSRPNHTHTRSRPALKVRCVQTSDEPLVAVEGDTVQLHYICKDPEGQVVHSSREQDEPITFELGTGEVIGNPLFQAFDSAVRGMGVGDEIELEITGGEYSRDLVFKVPADHPEIQRLQGRYSSQGGLVNDMLVELGNNKLAKVLEITAEHVVLDANNMLAGTTRLFTVEMVDISRPPV